MSKFVATAPSSYKKRIYRAAVLQRLRNTALDSLVCSIMFNSTLNNLPQTWPNKGKVAPVHAMKAYNRGSEDTAVLILNLGTRWNSVVSFMPRPFYHRRRFSVLTEQRAGWDPGWSESFWGRENYLTLYRDSSPGPPSPQPSHYTDNTHNRNSVLITPRSH